MADGSRLVRPKPRTRKSFSNHGSQREWFGKSPDVSHGGSRDPEWKLVGPTGASEQFILRATFSKKLWTSLAVIFAGLGGFLAWLIPVLINLYKN